MTMTGSVDQSVSELKSALEKTFDEDALLEFVGKKLASLREIYRSQKDQFTPDAIDFLKKVARIEKALHEFIEALAEKSWIRTRDDAHELATRFQEVSERLAPHVVAQRAAKEVREMVERSKSLPAAAVVEKDADYLRRIVRVEAQSRVCRKCGSKMVLRGSQYGLFWGCSTFPTCFGRTWLTKEESARLSDDRYDKKSIDRV